MPFKEYNNLDVLEEDDMNNIMSQTVLRFDTEAERSAQLGSPTEGMLSYIPGNGYESFDGSDWVKLLPAGVPAGGTTGQVLAKLSDADGDVGWITP